MGATHRLLAKDRHMADGHLQVAYVLRIDDRRYSRGRDFRKLDYMVIESCWFLAHFG